MPPDSRQAAPTTSAPYPTISCRPRERECAPSGWECAGWSKRRKKQPGLPKSTFCYPQAQRPHRPIVHPRLTLTASSGRIPLRRAWDQNHAAAGGQGYQSNNGGSRDLEGGAENLRCAAYM